MATTHFETVGTVNPNGNFKEADTVKTYKTDTSLKYPHIFLECESILEHQVRALKGVLEHNTLLERDDVYPVYVKMKDVTVHIGNVANTRLKTILSSNEVFGHFKKSMYLDESTQIVGDMLFAMCKIPE